MTLVRKKRAQLDIDLEKLSDLKSQIDVLLTEVAAIEERAIETMRRNESKKRRFKDRGGKQISATLVEPERMITNEGRLRRKIGPRLWTRITDRRINDSKLKEAIKDGEVQVIDVAACTEIVPSKPYIRITRK